MACRYFVGNRYISESEFKQLLNDGLLDQLIANNKVSKINKFKLNEEYIEKAYKNVSVENVRVPVTKKINQSRYFNTERKKADSKTGQVFSNDNYAVPRKNPAKVIEESNKQIDSENKKRNETRPHNKFILGIKQGNIIEFGGLDVETKQQVIKSLNALKPSLEEGIVYMFVPQANGFSAVKLYTSHLGQTSNAAAIRARLKQFFEKDLGNKQTITDSDLNQLSYKRKFSKDKNGVYITDANGKPTLYKTLEEFEVAVLGKFDNNGVYTGEVVNGVRTEAGLLSFIDSEQINKGNYNTVVSNQGKIETDLGSEGGNFFNNSSFQLDLYKVDGLQEEIDKLLEDSQAITEIEDEVANEAVKKETAETTNQNTKKEESKLYNEAFPEDVGNFDDFAASLLGPKGVQENPEGQPNHEVDNTKDQNPFEDGDPNKGDFNIDDLKLKVEKVGWSYRKQNKIDLQKELDYIREKIGDKFLQLGTFKTIASLKKYLPTEVYEQLQEVSKNGKSVRGLFTEAAVFLSERAFEGTGYHEAFHVVFNLSLNLAQRIAILNEARTKFRNQLSENPTFIEIEELLADKFQQYVMNKGVESESLGARILRFFKALFRNIQTFFSKNSRININDLFADIDLGLYKNKRVSFQNTDLTKIDPTLTRLKVEEITEREFKDTVTEYEAIDTLKYKAMYLLDQLKKTDKEKYRNLSDPEIIAKITVPVFYSELYKSILNLGAAVQLNLNKAISENNEKNKEVLETFLENITELKAVFDNNGKNVTKKTVNGETLYVFKSNKFLDRFNRSLNAFGIKINIKNSKTNTVTGEVLEDQEDIEDTSLSNEERYDRSVAEFNPSESTSQYLKRKLATIVKKQGGKIISNNFGTPTYYNPRDVFNFLGQEITDSYDAETMKSRINALENKKGFMSDIIELTNTDPEFTSKLFTDLGGKTFIKYQIVYEENGDYKVINANQEDFKSSLNKKIIGEFLVEDNTLFRKYPKGHPKEGQRNFEDINTEEVAKVRYSLTSSENPTNIKNRVKDARPENRSEVVEILTELSKELKRININFTPTQLELIWNPPAERQKASYGNIIMFMESLDNVLKNLEEGKNPFLHLVEQEFLDNKNILRPRRVLEDFVSKAFYAFDNQLVAAHRNADGKTVYAIQLSNYLNKKMAILKDQKKFTQYLEKIKNDPLLSNMPIFKILADENGQLKSDILEQFEITVFDALARKGKKKSVSYSKLSPIEIVTTQLALFHNNNKKGYSRFMLPVLADSPTMAMMQFKRQTIDEVKESLTQVALAEVERINFLNTLGKNSLLRDVKHYFNKGTKFQVLSFLNGKVDPNTSTAEEIKNIISDFLENEFLENEIKEYQKNGIIKQYNKETGQITFVPKLITKSKTNKETFFKEWLFNQYFMNTQMTTIFAGDPSFYKNTVDYQKRYKQIISPGMYTDVDNGDVSYEYSGYIFADEFVPTSEENKKYIIDNITKSNLTPGKKQELISFWENISDPKNKETNNVTDAATYVSIDRMVQIYESLRRMTPKHYEAAERIREGKERPEDAGMFVIVKPFQFTKVYIEGIEIPVQVKNSEFLLTKSFAEKSPKLMKVYDLLNDPNNGVDFIAFESAVKVGALANSVNEKGKPVFSSLELVDGKYELSEDAAIMTLNQEDWRLQQETPNKFEDKETNYGTQLRVLMIADMNMEGDYEIGGKKMKGREVAKLYQDLIVENLRKDFEKVKNLFEDENGEIDYEVLVNILKQEAQDRNYEEDIYTALELVPDTINPDKKVPAIPLWHPAISYKMESLFNSIFKNRISKQKINGGSLVNVTSYGVSDQLKYDAKTNTFEALMPLWAQKFFPKDKDGEPDITKVPDELKKMIAYRIPTEDKYSIFNIKVVGFADAASGGSIILPVEATTMAGLDFDIDKLFFMAPNFYINKKGEPTILKYIDKTSSLEDIVNSLINSSYSNLESFVNRRFKNKAENLLNLYDQAQEKIAKAYKERKQFFVDEDIQKVYNNFQDLKEREKKEKNKKKKKALKEQIDYYGSILSEYKGLKDNVEIHENAFKELKEFLLKEIENIKTNLDPLVDTELNSKKSIDNKLLEIMTGIMNNPHTQLSSVDTGNFEKLEELANEMRLLKIEPTNKARKTLKQKAIALIKNKEGKEIFSYRDQLKSLIEELEEEDFNINYPSTQLEIFIRNMTGKDLIGPFANNNTNHAKALFTELGLTTSLLFDNEVFSELNQQYSIYGERISKSLAMKLAAVVDNTKNPISSYLNLNMYTANLVALMSRLGIKEDSIFAFINQPVIEQLTQAYFNERGNVEKNNRRVDALKREWLDKLAKKTKKSIENKDLNVVENINLEELVEALANPESDVYYEVQYKVLKAFDEYFKIGEELNQVVQSTRIDTKTLGPSSADNYTIINQQQKLKNRRNRYISNSEQLLVESSDLRINPAFQKYAWLLPISVMDKIFPSIGTVTAETNDITFSILGRIKNWLSNEKEDSYSLTDKEARQIDSHFLTYLVSSLDFFRPVDSENNNVALKILEETPDKLLRFKKNNPDSRYMKFLEQLSSRSATKKAPFKHITFYNSGRDATDLESFKRLWGEMLEDPNNEVKELALDLIKYTFFSNGFNFGPFTFFNVIPLKFFTDKFINANPNLGLKDKKGRTLNQSIEAAFNAIKAEDKMAETQGRAELSSEYVSRFLRQYAQATAANSLMFNDIAEPVVDNTLKSEKNITELKDNQVLVLVTGNNGTLNAEGQARIAYNGLTQSGNRTSFDPVPGTKGAVGAFATYQDKTNTISKGSQGKSYLVPGYQEQFNEDGKTLINPNKYYKDLEENNPVKYKAERLKQLIKIKESLSTLFGLARTNQNTEFLINDLRTPFNFTSEEIRRLLREIAGQKGTGIPSNVKIVKDENEYGRNYDIRQFGSPTITKVGDKNIMTFSTRFYSFLKRGPQQRFPNFLTSTKDNNVRLYQKIQRTDDDVSPNVSYIEIPITGLTNYVLQYDFYNSINENVTNKITKEIVRENTLPEGLDATDIGFATPAELGMTKKETKIKEEEETNPLGVIDIATVLSEEQINELDKAMVDPTNTDERTVPETNPVVSKLDYNAYLVAFNKKVKDPGDPTQAKDLMPQSMWDSLDPSLKKEIIKC